MMQNIVSPLAANADTIWQHASWYRALTLPERLISLRIHRRSAAPSIDYDNAQRRLQRWQSQPPFNKGDYFAQRLAQDGLTEEELLSLLAESAEEIQTRTQLPPAWLMRLIAAFEEQPDPASKMPSQPSNADERPSVAFLNTIRPLLISGLSRLHRGIQELTQSYDDLPFDPASIPSLLFSHLPERLLPRMSSTIVLELNVARVQGNLQGDTPQERFQHFLHYLAHPEHMLPLLEEYAVLARFITETIDRWVSCELELLTRLCDDWQEIRSIFTPDCDPGQLVDVEIAGGDSYRGGRTVMLLTWSSDFRLVYKPRSLSADMHFQDLLSWLNSLGFQPAFRILNILNKDDYAWSEFVSPSSCTAPQEVERFYVRQGAYLALLYVLNASDMHANNVIAAGEHPMLIDLETLLQPRFPVPEDDSQPASSSDLMHQSLLRIGLLPEPDQQDPGVDVSGMGDSSGQLTPETVAVWRGVGTDEMRVERERVEIPTGLHRPRLLDENVDTFAFHDQVSAGFRSAYSLLIKHKHALLTQLLPRFAHDEVRCLLRDSETYALLLKDSFHPNLLRDALDRDRLLDRLWLAVEREPWLSRTIVAERHDLQAGDTPLFVAHPGSRNLRTSLGHTIPDFFSLSGLDTACDLIRSLDEQDLQHQLSLIQSSFNSLPRSAPKPVEESSFLS
jgi:type 2 lantibiotic biosynthesis protein LanM